MAVELPAPGLGLGRLAHERQIVEPLRITVGPVRELTEVMVQTHDIPGERKTLRAERRAHEIESLLALRLRQLVETEAVADIGARIAPPSPLGVIDRICGLIALLGRQGCEELPRLRDEIRVRGAFLGINGEQPVNGLSGRRDTHVRRQGLSVNQVVGSASVSR